MPPAISAPTTTSLTITNPLILYRALLATKRIQPSPTQYRLAFELQKIYHRLKDYSPDQEYGARIKAISKSVQKETPKDGVEEMANHPIRHNPLFANLFAKVQERETLALTRVLTDSEEAMKLDSPKGFLLHGEVGTGKSMFLDLLADSLPNKKKRRWHFNTFMLENLAQLEELRRHRLRDDPNGDSEHSLLVLAKDMIEKSPILFLDEFQLPDRATSKILSNLFTTFFQLGGVLIASSNRMPDELAKASGIDYYKAPSRGGLVRKLFGVGSQRKIHGMFPSNNEYASFVDLLKARCEIYDLSGRDWRRREAEETDAEAESSTEAMRVEMIEGFSGIENLEIGKEQDVLAKLASSSGFSNSKDEDLPKSQSAKLPKKYFLTGSSSKVWNQVVERYLTPGADIPKAWGTTILTVYGRTVTVPRCLEGVTYWSFLDLCGGSYGPADYITLASTFHTLILDEVPVLTNLQKNEARRMITLLDALYEARCKLIIRAEAGPDELFFPETNLASATLKEGNTSKAVENDGGDAVYPETLSEIYQDQTSPFRPNVSIYDGKTNTRSGYDPDEDSDFGPVPGKGNEIGRQVDFGMTSSFTGEDEKFAYKRARSRLWELCSASWHARTEPGWWTPLPLEVRRWERPSTNLESLISRIDQPPNGDVKLGAFIELDEHAGLQGKIGKEDSQKGAVEIPFREKRDPPPKIGWTHAWGMMKWGKKAGPWGQGPEGLDQKERK